MTNGPGSAQERPAARRGLSHKVLLPLTLLVLVVLTAAYARQFRGFQGDALFYYSVAVSLVWDHDLDLRNQYDSPLSASPGATVAGGQYFVDRSTGQAFTLFNPGAGLVMAPALAISRGIALLRGSAPADPFDLYYQRRAGYTTVLLTACCVLLLWHLLGRWLSPVAALGLPIVFLVGTNWLFYTVVCAGWAHAVAVFWTTILMWTAVRRLERQDVVSALLFGAAGGALFTTRNLGAVVFLFVAVSLVVARIREPREGGARLARDLGSAGAVLIGFLVSAAPQLLLFASEHGSALRTSVAASVDAIKPFAFPGGAPGPVPPGDPPGPGGFVPLSLSNLAYLTSNLFNLENGLFVFHPLFLVGLTGALAFRAVDRRLRSLVGALGLATYVLWIVDAAYFDTWFNRAAGSGFGERRILDLLPFFLLGTALLWEHARAHRWRRLIAALAIASACAYGVVLYLDLGRYERLAEARSSIADLLAFVFLDWRTGLVAAAVLLLLLAERREDRSAVRAIAAARRPLRVGVVSMLLILPAIAFRANPAWERQRVLERRGFFALYSPVPYVGLSSREWGGPDNSGRVLRRSPAAIDLPARIEKGDELLLRLHSNLPPALSTSLEVRLGGEILRLTPLLAGDHLYSFAVDRDFPQSKNLSVALVPFPPQVGHDSSVRVVEGRVLLRGFDEPPFGMIGRPADEPLSAAGAVIEGWVLDDRGVASVFAEIEGEPSVVRADFEDRSWPGVPDVFRLYPGMMRNWWKIRLDPAGFPSSRGRTVPLRVVAEDLSGHRTTIGTRTFVIP